MLVTKTGMNHAYEACVVLYLAQGLCNTGMLDYISTTSVRSHFFTNDQLNNFFPQFGVPVYCKVPQIDEKSVQLVRGSFVKK